MRDDGDLDEVVAIEIGEAVGFWIGLLLALLRWNWHSINCK